LDRAHRAATEEGLIDESGDRPAEADDERRRYYRLTSAVRRVLAAEIARLEDLLRTARAKRRSLKMESLS
jgi:hypothetical protein